MHSVQICLKFTEANMRHLIPIQCWNILVQQNSIYKQYNSLYALGALNRHWRDITYIKIWRSETFHKKIAEHSAPVWRRPRGYLVTSPKWDLKEDTGRREWRRRIDRLFRLSPLVIWASFIHPFSIPAARHRYNRNWFQIAFEKRNLF
jgi:hypothetical protein